MSGVDAPPKGHGYEHRDAQSRWLLFGGAGLLLLMALAFVIVAWLASGFEERDRRRDEPPHPMAVFRGAPPGAQLQSRPSVDYRAFSARQRELLTSYGWVDPGEGLVRIPVERAMDLALERGMPARGGYPEDGQ